MKQGIWMLALIFFYFRDILPTTVPTVTRSLADDFGRGKPLTV